MTLLGQKKIGKLELAVALLLFGGGALLFWMLVLTEPKEEEPFTLQTTRYSQDYTITETQNGQKVVRNNEAGFSFLVPEGWTVQEQDNESDEFWVALRSPDARFDSNRVLRAGCGIDVSFADNSDPIEADSLRGRMEDLLENQALVDISGYDGVQTTNRPATDEQRQKYGTHITVRMPTNEKDIVTIGALFYQDTCAAQFQAFLPTFQVN